MLAVAYEFEAKRVCCWILNNPTARDPMEKSKKRRGVADSGSV